MASRFILLVVIIIGFSTILSAQKEAGVIHPIWIEARVLGILEHHDALAVLQVLQVEATNEIHLARNSEILTEFVFGTKKSGGEPKLDGVKANMLIRAEIDGKFNPASGQWDYRVFRYQLRADKTGVE